MGILKSMGKNPWGERLKKVRQSVNYVNGAFHNHHPVSLMGGVSGFFRIFFKFLNKPKTTRPPRILPSVKTDLKNLTNDGPVLVWFGHSSYLLKIAGKHILVDPVFSGYASPFRIGSAKSFEGTNVYAAEDMPSIDVLLISHDHYDHCDYKTILELHPKVKRIVTSLGVGSHLEYWGVDMHKVTELGWSEHLEMEGGIHITAESARHFSGRGFKRAKTLWSSFVLKIAGVSIYIGADSGYDNHFKEIGEKHGPFELAILESGQYNEAWKSIHMMPEETVQASLDVRARRLLPVHWGKFSLALHPWNEPIERILKKAEELKVEVSTPRIGEPWVIRGERLTNTWWR